MPGLDLAQDVFDIVGDRLIAEVQVNDLDQVQRH